MKYSSFAVGVADGAGLVLEGDGEGVAFALCIVSKSLKMAYARHIRMLVLETNPETHTETHTQGNG